jgi:hypothetical protein
MDGFPTMIQLSGAAKPCVFVARKSLVFHLVFDNPYDTHIKKYSRIHN